MEELLLTLVCSFAGTVMGMIASYKLLIYRVSDLEADRVVDQARLKVVEEKTIKHDTLLERINMRATD